MTAHATAGRTMRLRLTDPTTLVLDTEATYVQAEDASGRFGVLPGHEGMLTALVPGILVYRVLEQETERERYAAVRRGVLRVSPEGVEVAARELVLSENMADLEKEISGRRTFQAARSYRSVRSLYQMQLAAWRRLMEYEDVRARQR